MLISNEQTLEFFSTNDLDVYNICRILKTKLNLQGFHDHFKAVKKIGRGNFASVPKNKKTLKHYDFKGLFDEKPY